MVNLGFAGTICGCAGSAVQGAGDSQGRCGVRIVFNVNVSKYFVFILDFGVWIGPAAAAAFASAASGPATRGVWSAHFSILL